MDLARKIVKMPELGGSFPSSREVISSRPVPAKAGEEVRRMRDKALS